MAADDRPNQPAFDLAMLTDPGTNRPNNEDACGHLIESSTRALFVVADGVGGYEGGEIASRMAVDITLEAYRDSPPAWDPAKRLHRAVQRANIEIHNLAITVTELRMMATTLTAVAVNDGMMSAAHVGDCRLYLVRHKKAVQLTKDHTVVGERVRMGLLTKKQARNHPERSAINRCLGHELIAAVDRISIPLEQGDRLLLCSDGLYTVIEDDEFDDFTHDVDAESACRRLIETANARGTADNLTVAMFRMLGATPARPRPSWRDRLRGMLKRS